MDFFLHRQQLVLKFLCKGFFVTEFRLDMHEARFGLIQLSGTVPKKGPQKSSTSRKGNGEQQRNEGEPPPKEVETHKGQGQIT